MKSREERIKEIEEVSNQDPYSHYHNEHINVALKALSIIKELQEEIEKLKEDLENSNYELKYQTDMRKLDHRTT